MSSTALPENISLQCTVQCPQTNISTLVHLLHFITSLFNNILNMGLYFRDNNNNHHHWVYELSINPVLRKLGLSRKNWIHSISGFLRAAFSQNAAQQGCFSSLQNINKRYLHCGPVEKKNAKSCSATPGHEVKKKPIDRIVSRCHQDWSPPKLSLSPSCRRHQSGSSRHLRTDSNVKQHHELALLLNWNSEVWPSWKFQHKRISEYICINKFREANPDHFSCFYRTQVYLGSDLWVRVSVSEWGRFVKLYKLYKL